MDRIPILHLGDLLLVSIQVDMDDQLALQLEDDLGEAIVDHQAHGVLIDISAVELADSFIGRMLGSIAAMARVVAGMQPAVAITLVDLGLSLPNVQTALDVDAGVRLLGGLWSRDHMTRG